MSRNQEEFAPSSMNRNQEEFAPSNRRLDEVAEWRSRIAGRCVAGLLFLAVTGLGLTLAPFCDLVQVGLLAHVILGIVLTVPLAWYLYGHWRRRRGGNLSHYQFVGYLSLLSLAVATVSGWVLSYQGLFALRLHPVWDLSHLMSGIATLLLLISHFWMVVRKNVSPDSSVLQARRTFARRVGGGCLVLFVPTAGLLLFEESHDPRISFPESYSWRFGKDRPFAPSLARLDYGSRDQDLLDAVVQGVDPGRRTVVQAALNGGRKPEDGIFEHIRKVLEACQASTKERERAEAHMAQYATFIESGGAVDASVLAESSSCGRTGCHEQVLNEWLPSAHRFASLDPLFQGVQEIMAKETSPEHTRYCAGCHDPISLFSGAKNAGNVTLSAQGADEGASCVVCHSIVQVDVRGNADYTVRPPRPYLYERRRESWADVVSGFLIRTAPKHHIASYSRPLYKTPEYCGACHKQYLDEDVNRDIGKVQGQNQYDNWRKSSWNKGADDPKTVSCRECHMFLEEGVEPGSGDLSDSYRNPEDGKHRNHRFLAANQYVPQLVALPNAAEHTKLTEEWLRGEIEIPEIAGKWADGPVVKLSVQGPDQAIMGQAFKVRILLSNNKTGHDFPNGPLDMIESWVEVRVTDSAGTLVDHRGIVNQKGVLTGAPIVFKADGFDREGEAIDRHNLWDLVGASYKRSLYPRVTDAVSLDVFCPRGSLEAHEPAGEPSDGLVELNPAAVSEATYLDICAVLWYRKANPMFLDRVFGTSSHVRSPITEISRSKIRIPIRADVQDQ